MKYFLSASAVSLALLVSGCAAPPPINFSVPNVGFSTKKIDAEMKSMTVTIARPDEKTGNLPQAMTVLQVPQLWQTSLTEALNKMVIFTDDSSNKVNLTVKILKLDVPTFGVSMTSSTAARYELINRRNGAIVYTQDIESSGVVPADYAFVGTTRALESVNRAVQNNIALFLQALQTVDISKPMFPAQGMTSK